MSSALEAAALAAFEAAEVTTTVEDGVTVMQCLGPGLASGSP